MRNCIVFQFQHKVLTHYQPKNTFRTESQLCRNEEFRYKRSQNHPTSSYFVLGGIMSFFGLDEESKRERQYDKEVENNKEEDFEHFQSFLGNKLEIIKEKQADKRQMRKF